MSLKERSMFSRWQRKQTFLSKLYRKMASILFIGFITFAILSLLDNNSDNLKAEVITTIMLFGCSCFFGIMYQADYMVEDEDMEV